MRSACILKVSNSFNTFSKQFIFQKRISNLFLCFTVRYLWDPCTCDDTCIEEVSTYCNSDTDVCECRVGYEPNADNSTCVVTEEGM